MGDIRILAGGVEKRADKTRTIKALIVEELDKSLRRRGGKTTSETTDATKIK